MNEKEQDHKVQRKLGSLLSGLALMLSVILCLTVVVQTKTNGYVQIGGFSLFRVVTGSMEPTLPVGTLLVCQQTDIEAINEGDIICFRSRDTVTMGKIITHRVTAVLKSGEGDLLLETRGDANLSADAQFVTRNNLIGRVNSYAEDGSMMTSVVNLLTDKVGFMTLIMFPTLVIAGFILRMCMKNMQRDIERVLEEEKRAKEDKSNLYTQEEYATMLERIRNELLEELKQGVKEYGEQQSENSKTE